MVNDPIANMLTMIRNANMRKHETVTFPAFKLGAKICQIMIKQGYLSEVKTVKSTNHFCFDLCVRLRYKHYDRQPVLHGLKRISKPGLRIYRGVSEIPKVLNGLGMAIISTSKGVMTNKEARQHHVGGEVLAYI